MITKRNYKITPETRSYGNILKVEVWNDYGMKRTVYEKDMDRASEVIYDWWEKSEKEFDKMNSLNRAIAQCVEIDISNGKEPSLD
tara:strand:+ start:81 stop:335 length:255 start_codon:yes stop_codon:yes gene_type:complete